MHRDRRHGLHDVQVADGNDKPYFHDETYGSVEYRIYTMQFPGNPGVLVRSALPVSAAAAAQTALGWLLAMQSSDGGWAAFDVDNNWEILTHVPFADHNAMLDPTCADITGRTLESLAANGFDRDHASCRRAIEVPNMSTDSA